MRTKRRNGGRARLYHFHRELSPSALSLIGQDNSMQGMEPEISSDTDGVGQFHDIAYNTSGAMAVPVKKNCVLCPEDKSVQEDCLETNWLENDICIKCNSGGKVLVCCESGCPLTIHEKCMGCSARFNDMGRFCCPYCLYKRAIAESLQAREKAMLAKKALSVFLKKETIVGNGKEQKTGTAKRKEFTLSTVARSDNKNMMESNDLNNPSFQLEEDHDREEFAPEGTTSNLPCEAADKSLLKKQNDVSLNRCNNDARLNDCDDHTMVVKHQTLLGAVAAGGSDGVCCREVGTTYQCETLEVSEKLQEEHQRQVHDNQHKRIIEDEQEAEHWSASPVEEEKILDGALHVSNKEKLSDTVILNDSEGKRAEELIPEQVQETTVPFTREEASLQLHSKANRVVETADSVCGGTETLPMEGREDKRKYKTRVLPSSTDSLRSSSRKSSPEQRTSAMQNERKSRHHEEPSQRRTSPSFPTVRRKKLPWRDLEEEMLKEGVEKFSTKINKNLPWRKILVFGRHVFDGSRTPADLKDKWRNITKARSANEK